jgi:hypothetical protein
VGGGCVGACAQGGGPRQAVHPGADKETCYSHTGHSRRQSSAAAAVQRSHKAARCCWACGCSQRPPAPTSNHAADYNSERTNPNPQAILLTSNSRDAAAKVGASHATSTTSIHAPSTLGGKFTVFRRRSASTKPVTNVQFHMKVQGMSGGRGQSSAVGGRGWRGNGR